eukprot:scaffold146747_cov18-Tisochrysis_lutea.AAC.1
MPSTGYVLVLGYFVQKWALGPGPFQSVLPGSSPGASWHTLSTQKLLRRVAWSIDECLHVPEMAGNSG